MPAITAQPGETQELVATFNEPGDVMIGCHFPGHWESGMHTTFTVVDA